MKSYLRTLLAMVLVGTTIALGQCYFARCTLDDHVERLMRDCDAGRHREAFDRTAESLRRWTTFEVFRDYMQARKRAFGQYEGLGSVGFGTSISRRRDSGSVKIKLLFERSSATGKFNYRRVDGVWRLAWFKIPLRLEKSLAERPPAEQPPAAIPPPPGHPSVWGTR